MQTYKERKKGAMENSHHALINQFIFTVLSSLLIISAPTILQILYDVPVSFPLCIIFEADMQRIFKISTISLKKFLHLYCA